MHVNKTELNDENKWSKLITVYIYSTLKCIYKLLQLDYYAYWATIFSLLYFEFLSNNTKTKKITIHFFFLFFSSNVSVINTILLFELVGIYGIYIGTHCVFFLFFLKKKKKNKYYYLIFMNYAKSKWHYTEHGRIK